jgi:hypothetical protein
MLVVFRTPRPGQRHQPEQRVFSVFCLPGGGAGEDVDLVGAVTIGLA